MIKQLVLLFLMAVQAYAQGNNDFIEQFTREAPGSRYERVVEFFFYTDKEYKVKDAICRYIRIAITPNCQEYAFSEMLSGELDAQPSGKEIMVDYSFQCRLVANYGLHGDMEWIPSFMNNLPVVSYRLDEKVLADLIEISKSECLRLRESFSLSESI